MNILPFIDVAEDLELAGLLWRPEIGDEVSDRRQRDNVSILVDPQGLSPLELRSTFIWLPTVEQIVTQFEARQAVLQHAGLEMDERAIFYKAVIKTNVGPIESKAQTLRIAMGLALRNLLLAGHAQQIN